MTNAIVKNGLVLTFGALLGSSVFAGENVAESNIAAIFQPTLRTAQVEAMGESTDAVSLLDGIVLEWRDPSRSVEAPVATAEVDAPASNGNVALENIRGIYTAYSAN
ncbi:MAG: hypothetical protein AAFY29_04495 [Pseudomonadota bacterium]